MIKIYILSCDVFVLDHISPVRLCPSHCGLVPCKGLVMPGANSLIVQDLILISLFDLIHPEIDLGILTPLLLFLHATSSAACLSSTC